MDEEWPRAEAVEDLCQRRQHARVMRPLPDVSVGEDWSEGVHGIITQNVRPHVWYFVVSICDPPTEIRHRIMFELYMEQDGSEFSVEMRWMLVANTVCLSVFTVLAIIFYRLARAFYSSAGSLHPVIWTLAIAMCIQFVAQALHTGHLLRYRGNGYGVPAFEVISEMLFMTSQVILTSLLIIIGMGYTLLQSKVGSLGNIVVLCVPVAVLHILLVGFSKLGDESSYKFHENEGAFAWILIVLRSGLYVAFLRSVRSTAREGGARLQSFLTKFQIAGSVYFLSYPVVFIITWLFAQYLQYGIMAVGLMIMQMGSNIYLSRLFLTRGEYFKVSSLSSSDLPGGFRVGRLPSDVDRMVKAE